MSNTICNFAILSVMFAAATCVLGEDVSRLPQAVMRESTGGFRELTVAVAEIPEEVRGAGDELVSLWHRAGNQVMVQGRMLKAQLASRRWIPR